MYDEKKMLEGLERAKRFSSVDSTKEQIGAIFDNAYEKGYVDGVKSVWEQAKKLVESQPNESTSERKERLF